MKSVAKRAIQRILSRFDYTIRPLTSSDIRAHASLERTKARNHNFNTVIDIGASDGRFSEEMMTLFPNPYYFLIEAQTVHEPSLRKFLTRHKNAEYVLAAAGNKRGKIYFDATDPFGGQASHKPYKENGIVVPVTTIDHEVKVRKLKKPFLLKFDTHGFEVEILKGAKETLLNTEVIIMECYNFHLTPNCLLFFEMCQHLGKLGFRCIDIFDPAYRVYDQAFWQVDLVFVRGDRGEFSYNQYT
jgi:FkbM family methyltransferase